MKEGWYAACVLRLGLYQLNFTSSGQIEVRIRGEAMVPKMITEYQSRSASVEDQQCVQPSKSQSLIQTVSGGLDTSNWSLGDKNDLYWIVGVTEDEFFQFKAGL